MTTGQASAVGTPRRLSPARFAVAGALSGLLTSAAAGSVVRFSGPPLCEQQDNAFSCLGTMVTLSLVSLVGLVLVWAGLWRWAGSPWPWAVALRGMPLVLGGLVVLIAGMSADGLRAVSFSVTAAENDVHSATLLLLWLACLAAAALAGAALWVSGRRRRAALLVPALVVALVGADALAAVGVLGYQTWRIHAVAPHPYGLVDPGLTLVSTRVEHGVLILDYRTPEGRDVLLTVADRPDSLDLTTPCSPTVTTPLGERVRACEQVDVTVPDGVAWATPASGPNLTGQDLVVVAEPDALVVLSLLDIGVTSADLLPRLPLLRRTGAVTLLRSTEESVDVR